MVSYGYQELVVKMDISKALKNLASVVKNSRSSLGMNQREYAKLFGTSHPSISNLEKAKYINLPDHSTLVRLAQILRIPYWQLIKTLEEGSDLPYLENLTVEQISAGITKVDSIDDCLSLLFVLTKKIEKLND